MQGGPEGGGPGLDGSLDLGDIDAGSLLGDLGLPTLQQPQPGLQWPPALSGDCFLQPGPHQSSQQPLSSWVPGGGSGDGSFVGVALTAATATAAAASADLCQAAAGANAQQAAGDSSEKQEPSSYSRMDAQTMASKLAAAREKNRLAQQRFRERQREKQKQAGEQCEVLQRQIDELASENRQLQRQSLIYQKVLTVRDAMLQTFTSLHPPQQARPGQQQWQQLQQQQRRRQQAEPELPPPPTAAAAAQGLARALDELPSEREMEEAAVEAGDSTQQEQQQAGVQAGGEPSASVSVSFTSDPPLAQLQEQPQWLLAETHRSGAAVQLDGSALRRVRSIPPVQDLAVRETVAAMVEPEQLLDYYRQWQAELSISYQAAEAGGFDEASVAEVAAVQDRMAQVWWHVGELKPAFLCYLAHAALPEDSGKQPLWRDIAAAMLPQLNETSRAILRRAWLQYSKRLAKIAVGVSAWVRRLQQFPVQAPGAMSANAARALELGEITSKLAGAVQEEYVASMEFVAEQAATTTPIQKAFINHASAPFMPDMIAINYHILTLDAQERQAQRASRAGRTPAGLLAPPALPGGGSATGAGAGAGQPLAPGS